MKKEHDKMISILLVILAWLMALALLVWVLFKIKLLYKLL